MESVNLLIIEDDKAQIQIYTDAIDRYNKINDDKFIAHICQTFAQGKHALLSPSFDAAIIDLKLSNSMELEGKKLVEDVYQKIRIPIFVVSGSTGQIDDFPETALLKKRPRTVSIVEVLKEIHGIYKTGITSFLKPGGIIDQKLTEVFWHHLANDIGIWIKHNNKKTLLRYILSHFQEQLEISNDGDFEDYHPNEVYIKPPIKKNPHTGDLISYNVQYYVVLTPACDIAILGYKDIGGGIKKPKRKADKLMLVKTTEFDYKHRCLNNGKLDRNLIEKYVTNNYSLRYHYLPAIDQNNGFLIDFQGLDTLAFEENFSRVASISAPFIKDVISRFANYYSRQGQPTFRQDLIAEDLFRKGQPS
jgi:hypothetical protein